eukprot:g4907.t1
MVSLSSPSLAGRNYGAVDIGHDAFPVATASAVPHQRRRGQRWRGFVYCVVGAAVFCSVYQRPRGATKEPGDADVAGLVGVVAPDSHAPAQTPKSPSATGPASDGNIAPLSFTALNFYHIRDGTPGQLYPFLRDVKLIEPYRETTLSVSSPRDGYDYVWEVRGGDEEKADLRATASGAEAVVVLTILDDNMVTLKEISSEGKVARQLDEIVMVKYVRREIRTLTDDEREELLDAMFTLWEEPVNGGNGKEMFGNDYADIYAIQRLHFKSAMNNSCDHFHDGLGFLTNHILITNTFEYSLQKVNPKLTLPYWDFTIEDHESRMSFSGGGLKIVSPLFQESWFGSADPEDNVVKDGRWAYTEIPEVYDDNPGHLIPDVFGRLRSRWIVNDSPYLTRGMGRLCNKYDANQFKPWPTCEMHYRMATEHEDFVSWVWNSQGVPHGSVHIWIGGVFACDKTMDTISALIGPDNADALQLYLFDWRKTLWIDEYFSCEGTVSTDQTAEDVFSSGACGCLGYDLVQGDDWRAIYYNTNSPIDFDAVLSDYDDDTKRAVVAAVCSSTIHDGDHNSAGSSLDPSFWPIHPTMERLWMFSVLTGRTSDMFWPDGDGSTTDIKLSTYGDCAGHGGGDVFPFSLLDTDIDGWTIKTGIKGNVEHGNKLTNREVLAALDPSANMLPYVYDTFKWDHCLEAGVDFSDAWETPSPASQMKKPGSKSARRGKSPFHVPRHQGRGKL